MTADFDASAFVEIYRTDSPSEARELVDLVLVPQGIEAVVHDRVDHVFPTPSSHSGELVIAVPATQKDQAVALLAEYLDAVAQEETEEEGAGD
ncbi:MAG: hypothetical protein V2A73_05380, partial [Pseudomonadota bacterium]